MLPKFWRDGTRSIEPDALWGYLEPPKKERRETPLFLSYPVWIRELATIELPFAPALANEEKTLTDGVIELSRHVAVAGRTVSSTHEYKSLAGAVPLAGISRHLQLLSQARRESGLDLNEESTAESASADAPSGAASAPPSVRLPPGAPRHWLWVELGVGLVSGVAALVYFARSKRSKRKFLLQRDGQRGDLPANPALVASLAEAREALTRVPCACGALLIEAAVSFSELWFQGEPLGAGRITCASCGDTRRGYYRLATPESEQPVAPEMTND